MHVGLVIDNPPVSRKLVDALAAVVRNRVTTFRDINDLLQSNVTPDVILIGLGDFTNLRENDPMGYLRLPRRSRIVVVLHSRNLLDAAHILAYADAWVFEDINADRVNEVIDLGLEGHCVVPKQLLSRLMVDEIRLALLPRLTDAEFNTLKLLGQGLNNRAISEQLGLSEAVVKSLVRRVLSKLHFRNRTEAGVFAARQSGLLDEAFAHGDAYGISASGG